jgi:dipeptidyl aminopeptidase/acylaminoacyl peptidase
MVFPGSSSRITAGLQFVVLACCVLLGCASSPAPAGTSAPVSISAWSVFHEKKDRRESLSVIGPGENGRTVVVRTPYKIKQYLISPDGTYLAYLTNEYGEFAIFVQHRIAELRLKYATVKDSDGEFEFTSADKIVYRSKKDDVSIQLGDVREKLKRQFGFADRR